MNDFLRMDIFFVVATAAVALIAGLLAYAIYQAIRIMRRVETIAEMAQREAELLRLDIAEIRAEMRREASRFLGFIRGAARVVRRRSPKRDS